MQLQLDLVVSQLLILGDRLAETKSGLGVMGHSRVQLGLSIQIDRKMIRVVET